VTAQPPNPCRANLVPFEVGNTAATTHGATSERQIGTEAANQKRRLLRQIGLRANQLDGIGRALLDNYCRAQAKVVLLDHYFDREGFLTAKGTPRAATRVYFTAVNSARLALVRLNEHLKELQADPNQALADYLASKREYQVRNGDAD
jgi:hypothetical protein